MPRPFLTVACTAPLPSDASCTANIAIRLKNFRSKLNGEHCSDEFCLIPNRVQRSILPSYLIAKYHHSPQAHECAHSWGLSANDSKQTPYAWAPLSGQAVQPAGFFKSLFEIEGNIGSLSAEGNTNPPSDARICYGAVRPLLAFYFDGYAPVDPLTYPSCAML
jgi:hypothetical protein